MNEAELEKMLDLILAGEALGALINMHRSGAHGTAN